jgi:hypothetical protein
VAKRALTFNGLDDFSATRDTDVLGFSFLGLETCFSGFVPEAPGFKACFSLLPLTFFTKPEKHVSKPKKEKPKTSVSRVAEKSSSPLNVSARLATFTLVAVLKNQGLFEQALDVLDVLEQKGDNKKKVDQERKSIQTLLKNTQED